MFLVRLCVYVLCGRYGNGGVPGGADGRGEEQSAKANTFLSST